MSNVRNAISKSFVKRNEISIFAYLKSLCLCCAPIEFGYFLISMRPIGNFIMKFLMPKFTRFGKSAFSQNKAFFVSVKIRFLGITEVASRASVYTTCFFCLLGRCPKPHKTHTFVCGGASMGSLICSVRHHLCSSEIPRFTSSFFLPRSASRFAFAVSKVRYSDFASEYSEYAFFFSERTVACYSVFIFLGLLATCTFPDGYPDLPSFPLGLPDVWNTSMTLSLFRSDRGEDRT